jgi:hypothetical protein
METAITLLVLIVALLASLVLALIVEEVLVEGFVRHARFDRVQPSPEDKRNLKSSQGEHQ